MSPVRAIFAAAGAFIISIAIQGCSIHDKCDNTPAAVMQLDVNPSGSWGSATLAELLVESMSVQTQPLNNNSQAFVNNSVCANASVANGDIGPLGHGTQQYLRLTLSAMRSLLGKTPRAVVYGVPMNQIVASHGATILADFELFGYGGAMGLPLNITAFDGSSVTVRNTKPENIYEAVILADTGSIIDLGNLTTSGATVSITASQGGSVTGTLGGSVEVACQSGGYIMIENVLADGAIRETTCGDLLLP